MGIKFMRKNKKRFGTCCKECNEFLPPSYMLWNGVCVFCWFFVDSYREKNKVDVVINQEKGE